MSQSSNEVGRILGELRGGLVALDASRQLERVITAVQSSGKKGSITIRLDISPVGSENAEMHVTAKVTNTTPAEPGLQERSIFYAQRGQLHRNDPNTRQPYGGPVAVDSGRGNGTTG